MIHAQSFCSLFIIRSKIMNCNNCMNFSCDTFRESVWHFEWTKSTNKTISLILTYCFGIQYAWGESPLFWLLKTNFCRFFHKQRYVVFVRWKSYEWRNKNVTFFPNAKMINCKIQTFDVRNHFIYEKTRLWIHMNIRFSENLISISFHTKAFFVRFSWYNQVPIKITSKCSDSLSFIQLCSELIGVVRFVSFINLHVRLCG